MAFDLKDEFMSNDMFPQGFIDMMENAEYLLVSYTGLKQGPFTSDKEALKVRDSMPCPQEWALLRTTRVIS